jgi:hypothetical protein
MLLGIHEIDEQINTALVQLHWTSYLPPRKSKH